MSTALTTINEGLPTLFSDFFRPWNEFFDNGLMRSMSVPAVNIIEEKNEYLVSMAVPGMKKDDFNINIEGNMLTISSEKEENMEEKDKKFTRKEYSYTAFSRSFTLPDEIQQDRIEAKYADGVLKISLPRKANGHSTLAKQIAVK